MRLYLRRHVMLPLLTGQGVVALGAAEAVEVGDLEEADRQAGRRNQHQQLPSAAWFGMFTTTCT